jgi:riboflavin-specific deaminase-like protein
VGEDEGVQRPWVVASAAVSLDGFLDDAGPARLLLSNAADFDRVDAVRASVDAILVGAGTVRADDPRLLVRSPQRRAERRAQGRPESPVKVSLTAGGGLDPAARFFTEGTGDKLVYAATGACGTLRRTLEGRATVVEAGDPVDLPMVLHDLARRGVHRLLVEGGGAVHTAFLAQGLVDELHLAVAPVLLGAAGGRRFLDPVALRARLHLEDVTRLDDVAVLRYTVTHG